MKTLLVLRHGKSSWKDPGLADHDRPLNKRGKRDAHKMGQLVKEHKLMPDLVISSPALRAKNTAEAVAAACQTAGAIWFDKKLYLAGAATMVEVLRRIRQSVASTVMIVGHNPGSEELVEVLTGAPETLPTAALAQVTLPIDSWSELRPRTRGTLVNLWRPKEL